MFCRCELLTAFCVKVVSDVYVLCCYLSQLVIIVFYFVVCVERLLMIVCCLLLMLSSCSYFDVVAVVSCFVVSVAVLTAVRADFEIGIL